MRENFTWFGTMPESVNKLIMLGKIISFMESLIEFIEMLLWPTAIPEKQLPHISVISSSLSTPRNIELTSFGDKKKNYTVSLMQEVF